MKLLYFAWIRERIGRNDEDIAIPDEVGTAGELIAWLSERGEEYADAFQYPELVRVAMDREHVEHSEAIAGAGEIALFPPMTGG